MAELKLVGLGLRSYGNIIFNTDNAYDIGAAGATRPRDLHLGRNALIGGTLGVTGAVALSSSLAVTGTSTLTGNVGIGIAVSASVGLRVGSATLTGTSQYGASLNVTATSAATGSVFALYTQMNTAAGAYTTNYGYSIFVGAPGVNNTAVTTIHGIKVDNQGQAGSTAAYGVYIAAQSGAATTNIGLYNGGTSYFGGAIQALYGIASQNLTTETYSIFSLNPQQSTKTWIGSNRFRYYWAANEFARAAVGDLAAMMILDDSGHVSFYNQTSATSGQYALTPTVRIHGAGHGVGILLVGTTSVGAATVGGIRATGAVDFNTTLAVAGTSTLTGNVSIGGSAASGAEVLRLVRTTGLTGVAQYNITNDSVFSAEATTSGTVIYSRFRTVASAFTMVTGYGIYLQSPALGATSAVTTLYGMRIENQGNAQITNAYGVYIAAQSGAATKNIGLYNAGTTTLVGALTTNGGLMTFGANDSGGAGYRLCVVPNV